MGVLCYTYRFLYYSYNTEAVFLYCIGKTASVVAVVQESISVTQHTHTKLYCVMHCGDTTIPERKNMEPIIINYATIKNA